MTHGHHALVDRQFGGQANAYLASAAHSDGPDLVRMTEVARTMPGAAALDLGCGGGHASYAIAPHVGSVIACDLAPAMLETVGAEAARRGFANVSTTQAAAEALPFPDASFDLIVCRLTAHHWRDFDAGVAQARRVLKPGGRALFADTIAPADPLVDTHLQAIELLRDPSHLRDRRADEWISALGRAGFRIEAMRRHSLPLDFASWVARMRTPDANAAAIRAIWAAAPAEVRDALAVQADGSFTIEVALFEAVAG